MKYLVMDLETTGLNASEGAIPVSFAAFVVEDKKVLQTFNFYINGGVEIEEEASKVTGITQELIEEKGINGEDAKTIILTLFENNDIIVAHNTRFDLDMLCFGDERFEHVLSKRKTICTMTAAVDRMKYGPFKLGVVCRRLGMEIDEDKLHDALYDIELTNGFLQKLLSEGGGFRYNTICIPSGTYGEHKARTKSKGLKRQRLMLKVGKNVSDEKGKDGNDDIQHGCDELPKGS